MKIRMITTAAGPTMTLDAGKEYDVSKENGSDLCAGGHAIPVPDTAETAARQAPENAAQRTGKAPARKGGKSGETAAK